MRFGVILPAGRFCRGRCFRALRLVSVGTAFPRQTVQPAASRPGRAGLRAGLRLGLGFFLGGVSWLYVALNRYGGMPPALAGFAIFLFCAYLALFPATVGALYARLRRGGLWCDGLLVAGLWTIAGGCVGPCSRVSLAGGGLSRRRHQVRWPVLRR